MSNRFKIILLVTMTTALTCGFLHHLVPPAVWNFERLHIFLFNLCCGGTLLLHMTEGKKKLSRKGKLFFFLALLFAVAAFFQVYSVTLVVSLLLAIIVESIRISHFGSVVPKAIFSRKERVAAKFHQASLLCLSIGLLLSAPVTINSVYTHWVVLDKLKLDTFYLGFSFPLSLISMSVIFSLMKGTLKTSFAPLKELAFWLINLGVIIFFLFILAELYLPQMTISIILFASVMLILYLYYRDGLQIQQKAFLTSGIFFLLFTSVTGICYIFLSFSDGYDHEKMLPLLRLHAFTALYGWNLSGLAVICRRDDFPIKLHSQRFILLHWLTVAILCPLGYFFAPVAIIAVIAYLYLLWLLFFNGGRVDREIAEVHPIHV